MSNKDRLLIHGGYNNRQCNSLKASRDRYDRHGRYHLSLALSGWGGRNYAMPLNADEALQLAEWLVRNARILQNEKKEQAK